MSTNTPNPIEDTLLRITGEIEDMVEDLDISYIEACVSYCEKSGMEMETLGDIIEKNQVLKAKIQREAEDLHYMKKKPRLF